ncbi:carboxymuconolactone decarboxylase family protein [Arthrobacter sp. SDTb3-6]|uniref:carboxymuconolactone decarboxylase family protein n=1 Tax=Arthrobacter sp. SDTb3-6 TaxID=2713571 RepID=UPI00159E7704|nr:carboxymuconolactone decarboxylase family protein [Arthrobacter sp. SDTb3-6]NVN00181.1 carboxymuconolactone decarboxylase family protein [Arthrobacter sp. SDTb3-6]
MARIPYLDEQTASNRTLSALAGKRKINIFRLIAQSENAAPEVLALGQVLSRGSSLPPVDREVVILRVAELSKAQYQAHEHHAVALRHGFSEDKIRAVAEYPAMDSHEHLTDFERSLIDFTDAVVRETSAPDELFECIATVYDNSRMVELVLIIGFYMMVGRVMNTFNIELESGPVGTFQAS